MATMKRKSGRSAIPDSTQKVERCSVRFVSAEQEPLQQAVGAFSESRLAEVIGDMATLHFQKIDEKTPKLSVDEVAERKIKALFDKHASGERS